MKFINENDVVQITQKSFFDGRMVKTDMNKFYVDLTTFTGKVFKNVKIKIDREIIDLKTGLYLALLIYEVILYFIKVLSFP